MIPKDPAMLLSYINTQLRDAYPSLDELADALEIDKKEVEEKLGGMDYHYDPAQNKFI